MKFTLSREISKEDMIKYTKLARKKGYQDLKECLQRELDLAFLALECPDDWNPGSLNEIEHVEKINLAS